MFGRYSECLICVVDPVTLKTVAIVGQVGFSPVFLSEGSMQVEAFEAFNM
jgi:hypothetical protein